MLVQSRDPKVSKYWRLAYRFAGKQKALALGVYPDVILANARTRRDVARNRKLSRLIHSEMHLQTYLLLFVLPGELRKMEWKDVNLDASE